MDFTWRDGERTIRFGRGVAAEAVELCGGGGYTLLTTERALGALPALGQAAGVVHLVPGGRVDEIAGDLLDAVRGDRLVALGGGRVVDVAKALAAAGGVRAMAVPTTLSGAEMTVIHRPARGAPEGSGFVRPAVVVNDPALSASQPVDELAASALNALGHAIEGPLTPRANPVATMAAREAVRLIDEAYGRTAVAEPGGGSPGAGAPAAGPAGGDDVDRDALALASLLAGYTIDSTGYGIHHVMSQTLVRFAGAGHGPANAVLLPHTARRLGDESGAALAERILPRTGATTLREIGVAEADLERCADEAAARPQLDGTPPRASRDELLALYRAAY